MSNYHERVGFPRTYLRVKDRTKPIEINFPYYKYNELRGKATRTWAYVYKYAKKRIADGDDRALYTAKFWQLHLWVFHHVYIHPTREFHSINESDYISWLKAEIERQEFLTF